MDSWKYLTWGWPACCAAGLVAVVVYTGGGWFGAMALAAGLFLLAVCRFFDSTTVTIMTVALVCSVWILGSLALENRDTYPFDPQGADAGRGTIISEPLWTRSGTLTFRIRLSEIRSRRWSGRTSNSVLVVGYRGPPPSLGADWSWTGTLKGSVLSWNRGFQLGWAAPWWELRSWGRQALSDSLSGLGTGPAALIEALLIGATDNLTTGEKEAFRLVGCSHVLALSGMHLTILAIVLQTLLKRRLRPWLTFLVVQGGLACFCFLAGPIPSLYRAWAMALLAGLWQLLAKPVPFRELLGQSFLLTALLWPEMLATLSLQLSFLALMGLSLWSESIERRLRKSLGRWPAAQLAPSFAAMAGTAPLLLLLFGEVRWIGVLYTPVMVALTGALMLVGIVALVAGAFGPWLVGFLAPVAQLLYGITFRLADWGSSAPPIPSFVAWLFAAIGGLGGLVYLLYKRGQRMVRLPVTLNYDSPAALQAFLDSQGYNALKRWGQNFLINPGARKQILAALDLTPGEPVWEVGPGLGALTHHLVSAGHPLTVFEIDPGYVQFLKDEFGSAPAGFTVVDGDVIKTWSRQNQRPKKCVGNLPYNAASAIVADFVEGGYFPEIFVVTVQLEMAQRMTATPGNKNYSSFSVLCQSAFELTDVVTLKPGSFYPAPEVNSRVVKLKAHHRYPDLDHRRFSIFVRECFSSRRKTLRNNLSGVASALHLSDESVLLAFGEAGVDLKLRAEVISVQKFTEIFSFLRFPTSSS